MVEGRKFCPGGYFPCGWLNPLNFLCSSQSFNCPINSLKMLPNDTIFSEDYSSLKLSDDFSLFYSYEEVDNYMVTTDILIGYQEVCLNPLEEQIDPNSSSPWKHWDVSFVQKCESLFWKNEKNEQIYTDPRVKEIGKVSKKVLYTDNSVDKYMADNQYTSFNLDSGFEYEVSIYFRYSVLYNR